MPPALSSHFTYAAPKNSWDFHDVLHKPPVFLSNYFFKVRISCQYLKQQLQKFQKGSPCFTPKDFQCPAQHPQKFHMNAASAVVQLSSFGFKVVGFFSSLLICHIYFEHLENNKNTQNIPRIIKRISKSYQRINTII